MRKVQKSHNLDEGKLHLNLAVYSKKVEGTYVIDIPSPDTHSYSEKEDEIKQKTDEALIIFQLLAKD